MAEEQRGKPRILLVPRTPRIRIQRRQLPTLVRYLIIASFGSVVAMLASSLLRTIGY